jgi:hypothetical protein
MKAVGVLVLAIGLAGCVTVTSDYTALDGSPIQNRAKFEADHTICVGEMAKASLQSEPRSAGDPFADGVSDFNRTVARSEVIEGCMAAKGYKIVSG